jgi:outer membrane protein assembly factor BamD
MKSSAVSSWVRLFVQVAVYLSLGGILAHCAHEGGGNPENDPDALYKEAEEALKDEKYLVAIEKFRDIKNRFPYSARATDSELRIADAYFEQESYLEAESAYEIFRELHPTHPRADYVQFRIGLSYFKLIPDNSSRDLSAAYRAMDAFKVLTDKYPTSEFVKQAQELTQEAKHRLAEHEEYVADFYYRREHYLSASYRYAALLQEFPSLGYDEEALFRLGECYYRTRMFSNAKDTFHRLLNQFPESSYKGAAQSMLDELDTSKN